MKLKKVYLEITNICNKHCAFCPGTGRKAQFMDREHFAHAAAQVKTVSDYIYLHVMGEPLLHPDLQAFLSICKSLSLKVIITTNGTLLQRNKDILLSSGTVHKVHISLHSFEANEAQGEENYFENCFLFAKEASEKGIISVLRLWNLDGDLPGLHDKNDEILSLMRAMLPGEWTANTKGVRIAEKLFLEWGRRFTWPELGLPILRQNGTCYGLRDQAGILVDGTVVPCCLDKNGDIALGNIFETELIDILNNERARRIREGFQKHVYTEELCRTCGYAGRFSTD